MKVKDAKKWVNALRSGKYKQTKQVLKNHEGYCCLGVACDIFPQRKLNEDEAGYASLGALCSYEKLGIKGMFGELTKDMYLIEPSPSHIGVRPSLANMNDNGYTFDEIADIIQIEYILGL